MDGSDLGGPGVVRGGEVLSVVLVGGDERQPGVLVRHKDPNAEEFGSLRIPPPSPRGCANASLVSLGGNVAQGRLTSDSCTELTV